MNAEPLEDCFYTIRRHWCCLLEFIGEVLEVFFDCFRSAYRCGPFSFVGLYHVVQKLRVGVFPFQFTGQTTDSAFLGFRGYGESEYTNDGIPHGVCRSGLGAPLSGGRNSFRWSFRFTGGEFGQKAKHLTQTVLGYQFRNSFFLGFGHFFGGGANATTYSGVHRDITLLSVRFLVVNATGTGRSGSRTLIVTPQLLGEQCDSVHHVTRPWPPKGPVEVATPKEQPAQRE